MPGICICCGAPSSVVAAFPRSHARGHSRGGGGGTGRWDGAEGCCAWAFWELRLGPPPASCQLDASKDAHRPAMHYWGPLSSRERLSSSPP